MMRRASSRSSDCFGLLILRTVNGICWKTKPGPMPATFVVDRKAVTRYAFVNVDFTRRAEPSEIVEGVRSIR